MIAWYALPLVITLVSLAIYFWLLTSVANEPFAAIIAAVIGFGALVINSIIWAAALIIRTLPP